MIIPLVSADGNAVIGGKPLVSAAGNQLLTLPMQEIRKIHVVGPVFLLIGKMDVDTHENTSYSNIKAPASQ
ncbi:hypothetical protein SDC9_92028 [bioreactor metagenome]|uniref:Uncharacterized protein n=1 Tax=bioreactor metagenome TaxID=1076179 RepID=A0A644ZZF6_9ZZZZ